jgi:hypothetical protein
MYEDDLVKYLRTTCRMYPDTSIVLETNKKVVLRCPDDVVARGLLRSLRHEGFAAFMKKGLMTDRFYVAVY